MVPASLLLIVGRNKINVRSYGPRWRFQANEQCIFPGSN